MAILFATHEAKPGTVGGTTESLKFFSQIFACAINVWIPFDTNWHFSTQGNIGENKLVY